MPTFHDFTERGRDPGRRWDRAEEIDPRPVLAWIHDVDGPQLLTSTDSGLPYVEGIEFTGPQCEACGACDYVTTTDSRERFAEVDCVSCGLTHQVGWCRSDETVF